MLETQGQSSNLQNGHDLTTKSQENDRSAETSDRYVPEPVTGRTTTASRSSLDQRAGSTCSVRAPSPGRATEPANGEVSRTSTQAPQILDPALLRPQESLHYFSYLGRLNPKRLSKGCVSTRNLLTSRPVIITSTSFVTTNVMDALDETACEHRLTPEYRKELVECCTCVCCVKAMFYHCTKDKDDEGRVAEHPCSCQGSWAECVPRWGILGILSIFLPCLWCYLPYKACENVPGYCRDWLAEIRLRAELAREARQARQAEASTARGSSSNADVETYEPVNLQRQEALRMQDPFDLLSRDRYVDVGTLHSM